MQKMLLLWAMSDIIATPPCRIITPLRASSAAHVGTPLHCLRSCLQSKDGSTGTHGHDSPQTNSHVTDAEEALHVQRGGQGAAGGAAGGLGGAGGAGTGGGGGSNGVGGAGAGELGLAVSGGRGAGLGDSLTIEIAGIRSRLLGLVVGVEDVSELLGGVAHGVGAEDTGGGVAVHTSARVRVRATDVAEDLTVVVRVQAGGRGAGDGVEHALAEIRVGSRGQSRGGSPRSADSRASSG